VPNTGADDVLPTLAFNWHGSDRHWSCNLTMAQHMNNGLKDIEDDFEDEDTIDQDSGVPDLYKAISQVFTPDGKDPATIPSWPPTLPIEVALHQSSIRSICESYKLTKDDWERLRKDSNFIKDVRVAAETLKKEGMTFKIKAQLQAEALLPTAWKMIHDKKGVVPATVRADLIKFVVRVAGLDASKDQGQQTAVAGTGLNIQINLN